MIKIALCVKQIPDTTDIRWTENNTIQREGVESVINPYDKYALELALKIKSLCDKKVQITVFTMGPLQAQAMLRKVLALGADNGILISDKKFAGSDTYATGKTISQAIEKFLPDFDLIVCGQFATDGDTAQTGPNIATFLNIPQVTFVKEFLEFSDNKMIFTRELEDRFEKVQVSLPALVCVMQNDFETSRAKINGVIEASKKDIITCSMQDLDLTSEQVGIKGSPTYVNKAFRNIKKHNTNFYNNSSLESAKLIKNIIQTQRSE